MNIYFQKVFQNLSFARYSWLFNYVIALFTILALNFVLPRMMPGDPLHAIYGDEALLAMTPELEAQIIRRFSLDLPLKDQFVAYIYELLRGDLGYSYYYKVQVSNVILEFIPWTLLLAGFALLISSIFGIILGIESAYRRGKAFDRDLLFGLMFLSGFPDFFIGILLLLAFGVTLGVAPLGGAMTPYSNKTGLEFYLDIFHHLALPLASLVLVQLAPSYLIVRNSMLTTLKANFIRTARSNGYAEAAIKYRHAGRNSLLPVVTSIGNHIPHLLIGTLFIEIVFSYPGLGQLLNNSINTRDYPLIQGILLVVTITVLTINLLVDLLYSRLDPRVRHAH